MSGQNQDRSGKYIFFTDSTKIPLKGNFIKENNFKINESRKHKLFVICDSRNSKHKKKKHLKRLMLL